MPFTGDHLSNSLISNCSSNPYKFNPLPRSNVSVFAAGSLWRDGLVWCLRDFWGGDFRKEEVYQLLSFYCYRRGKMGILLLGHIFIHAVLCRYVTNRSWFMLSVCLPLQQYRMPCLKLSSLGVEEFASRTFFYESAVWLSHRGVFEILFFE